MGTFGHFFWCNCKLGTIIQVSKIDLFHSFIFSNCFIRVRVAVDLEPILGTLGMRWKTP